MVNFDRTRMFLNHSSFEKTGVGLATNIDLFSLLSPSLSLLLSPFLFLLLGLLSHGVMSRHITIVPTITLVV